MADATLVEEGNTEGSYLTFQNDRHHKLWPVVHEDVCLCSLKKKEELHI